MKILVYAWTFLIFSVVSATKKKSLKPKRPMPTEKIMSCAEFGKNARFNPHSVVTGRWLIFYYYGPMIPPSLLSFRVPSRREISYLHFLFDSHVLDDFDWKANMLLRLDESKNETVLLVERNYKGSYWMYIPIAGLHLGQTVPRYEIQLKQTKDNKYIAIMMCDDQTVYIMARLSDVPPKAKIVEEAAKIGYVGKQGRSYLYRGSQWMPMEDSDESTLWRPGSSPTERMEKAEPEIYQKVNALSE